LKPDRDRELITCTIERIFPAGTEIAWDSRRLPSGQPFLVLSGQGGPRWIVPVDPRLGRPFLAHWRPYGRLSRWLWRGAAAAYRLRALGRVPGVQAVSVAPPPGAGWHHLDWRAEEPPTAVVHIGTPGPTRKAVVGLVDTPSGALAAVAKLPLGPAAQSAILHEAAMLRRLAAERPARAPQIVYEDLERGIAVQEPMEGSPSGRHFTSAHLEWLTGLVDSDNEITLDTVRRAFVRRLETLDGAAGWAKSRLSAALDEIAGDRVLPQAWVHGDFAPWNLRRSPRAGLVALDWERACPDGLPLFDLVHFHTIQAQLLRAHWPSRAFTAFARAYLSLAGIDPALLRKVVIACLIEDALSSLGSGATTRAHWLADALGDVLAGAVP
jgi:hypothetical protein